MNLAPWGINEGFIALAGNIFVLASFGPEKTRRRRVDHMFHM
jgi:hypothetical protein